MNKHLFFFNMSMQLISQPIAFKLFFSTQYFFVQKIQYFIYYQRIIIVFTVINYCKLNLTNCKNIIIDRQRFKQIYNIREKYRIFLEQTDIEYQTLIDQQTYEQIQIFLKQQITIQDPKQMNTIYQSTQSPTFNQQTKYLQNYDFLNQSFQFDQMNDQDLLEYQQKLIQLLTLTQKQKNTQNLSINLNNDKLSHSKDQNLREQQQLNDNLDMSAVNPIVIFKFKQHFLDQLQGKNHQIEYFGKLNHQQSIVVVDTTNINHKNSAAQAIQKFISNIRQYDQLLKKNISILFQISLEQKISYPHLFTHIKEQFYKPNVFDNLQANSFGGQKISMRQQEQEIQKMKRIIDGFFQLQLNQQTNNYMNYVKEFPEFQEICLMVFRNIIIEEIKRENSHGNSLSSQNLQQNILNAKKQYNSFTLVEKLCKKFLIELQYIQFEHPNNFKIISLGSQKRFLMIQQFQHLLIVTLQKFQLLSLRRKSSHNIMVGDKNRKNSSYTQKSKKSSWKQTEDLAYFRIEEGSQKNLTSQNNFSTNNMAHNNIFALQNKLKQFIFHGEIQDSDQTSNYESSLRNTQSKFQQVSDQSTPKFKNSSIAQKNNHIRKKSHKDSFGGVDFDNLVYKDLSNPKKFIQQKGLRHEKQKDKHKHHMLSLEVANKKVFSQRFQAQQMGSLTYNEDQQSSIQFVPNFQTRQTNYFASKLKQSVSVNQNQPASPTYMNNNHFNFSMRNQNDENKFLLIKKMKGSNIQKPSQPLFQLEQIVDSPKLRHRNSQNSNILKPAGSGKALTSSEIIQFSGNLDQILAHTNPDNHSSPKKQQNKTSLVFTNQNDVFLSFSKNDKQKFIVQDCKQFDQTSKNSLKLQNPTSHQPPKPISNSDILQNQHTSDTILQLLNNQELTKKIKQKKYSYHTQKEQRQKYKEKQKSISNYDTSQNLGGNQFKKYDFKIVNYQSTKMQKKYPHKSSQIIYSHNQNKFQSNSQINERQKHEFYLQNNNGKKTNFSKIYRKQSQYVPLYKGVEISAEDNQNFNSRKVYHHQNNSRNNNDNNKRFQENSVRFSQIIDGDQEVFYVEKSNQNQQREVNNHRKQRKATDFYQSPSAMFSSGGNRTSQMIQKGPSIINDETTTVYNKKNQNKFQGSMSYLDVSLQNSSKIFNSGGGKNYSIISNISYDEQKRLDDLIELENQISSSREKAMGNMMHIQSNNNQGDKQLEYANIQLIEKLLIKRKKQKLNFSGNQINLSVSSKGEYQPKDWSKKQVFYFFESNPPRDPLKYTFYNKTKTQTHTKTHTNKRQYSPHNPQILKQTNQNPIINTSTSLYNFPTSTSLKKQIKLNRQNSLSSKSFSETKISIDKNINNSMISIPIKNEMPLKSYHNNNGPINLNSSGIRNAYYGQNREIDTRSNISSNVVMKSPVFNGNLNNDRVNYSVRNVPIQNSGFNSNNPVNISFIPNKSMSIIQNNSVQNLRSYPSHSIIKIPSREIIPNPYIPQPRPYIQQSSVPVPSNQPQNYKIHPPSTNYLSYSNVSAPSNPFLIMKPPNNINYT